MGNLNLERKTTLFVLLFLFCLALLPGAATAADQSGSPAPAGGLAGTGLAIQSQTEEIIGEGATLYTYLLTSQTSSGQDQSQAPAQAPGTLFAGEQLTKIFVLKLDLNNPYLEIKSLVGAGGTLAERVTVSQAVAGQKDAVAAVNGGFFVMNDGKPVGAVIRDGKLISSPNMRGDMPVFAIDQNLKPVFGFFKFTGIVAAANGKTYPLFGVNKTAYDLADGTPSDVNHLTLYNRDWGLRPRGAHPDYPDAMVARVENDTVQAVVYAKDAQFDIPPNGYVLWGAGTAAGFLRENLLPGRPVQVSYKTVPDYQKIKLATGSNTFLVQNKQVAEFQEEIKGKTARTAVGYAGGGKILYFVVAEKSPASAGIEQRELARFLAGLGIEEALNLDGGGSSAMVARRLGDFEITPVNVPKEGRERKIPDAIGVFNTAPPGAPKGLLITGPETVIAGVEAVYSVKGYDSHYHPWRPENLQWVLPAGTRSNKENIYKYGLTLAGDGPKEVTLQVSAGGVQGTKKIAVIRADDILALKVTPAEISAKRGQTIPLSFQIVTKDNRTIPIESRYVECQATIGAIENGVYETGGQRGRGVITAAFNGRRAQIPVQIECLFKDSAESWAVEPIEELAAAGLVKGFEDGTFRPDRPVTRAEMTALLARLLKWPPAPKEARFKDPLPEWAKGVISAAVAQKAVTGYPDGTFKADSYITRAELCAILDRALKPAPTKQKLNFKDAKEVPAWAKDAVARAVAAGLLRGYGDNTLRPKAQVTRAEMAAVLWRKVQADN